LFSRVSASDLVAQYKPELDDAISVGWAQLKIESAQVIDAFEYVYGYSARLVCRKRGDS